MKVCVVGSGGREHALAQAISRTAEVVLAPGNPGMDGFERTDLDPHLVEADMWVIGPEVPLVDGLADRVRAKGGLVFGPGADGARLEGSKAWMKDVLRAAHVPTAGSRVFAEIRPALEYLGTLERPYVIKTDGLAAGKGVLVTFSREEAERDIKDKLSGTAFGDAGRKIVIEEGLSGPELSVHAVCDGKHAYPLAAAQDFKRVADGDEGPNTGGMGSYSPVPIAGDDIVGQAMERAVLPTLHYLRKNEIDYRGSLYAGLMLTDDGLKVLEFNVRFGDPETQVLMARWTGDVTATLAAAASGALTDQNAPTFSAEAAVCVVLAAPGYPTSPETGAAIDGLERARQLPGVDIYAAGVSAGAGGRLHVAGGRVLNVVGKGPTLASARELAYRAVSMISWPGMVHRTDIALTAGGMN